MTMVEFYKAIINETENDDVRTIAQTHLDKLNEKNEKASANRAEKKQADAPTIEKILEILNESTPMITSEIGAKVGITTAKASALLRDLAKAGKVNASDVKIAKVGTRKGYTLAK